MSRKIFSTIQILSKALWAGQVTALVFLIAFLILVFPPVPAKPVEESGTTVENFTLFRYGDMDDDLFWKLAGKTGEQTDEGLIVREFNLVIREGDTKDDELLSELSGPRLRLQGDGEDQVAVMPGKIGINIEDWLNGVAWNVRYNFSESRVSGDSLELTQNLDGGKITLSGSTFEYFHQSEELQVAGGFQVESHDAEGELTQISGQKLSWPSGERITMTGNISASLPSGWELEAERMEWSPGGGLLDRGSSNSASKNN